MSDLKDPRVLFAAERTVLAWNRSCVALITLGFVIERFGLFLHYLRGTPHIGQRHFSFVIGIGLIIGAVVLASFSVEQFRRVLKTLSAAERVPGYWAWSGATANILLAVLGVFLVVYLVLGLG